MQLTSTSAFPPSLLPIFPFLFFSCCFYFFLYFQHILSFLIHQSFLLLSFTFSLSFLLNFYSFALLFNASHASLLCFIHPDFTLFNSLFPFFSRFLYFFIPCWCNILVFLCFAPVLYFFVFLLSVFR